MKWFYDLRISRKLIATFLIVVLMVAGLGVFAIRQLDQVNKASSEITTNWLPGIRVLGTLQLSMSRLRSFELQHILARDNKEFEEVERGMQVQLANLKKAQGQYAIEISEPEEKAIYGETEKKIATFLVEHDKIIALSRQGKDDEARNLQRGASTTAYRSALQDLDKLATINNNGADHSNQAADTTYSQARLWIIATVVSCIALAMLMAVWVSRLIARPLEQAVSVAQRVAGGDLTATIEPAGKDETGQLLTALKSMNDSLVNIVSKVREGTHTIAVASTEIAGGNLNLSSRTEQQASSLEETASAMEELTSTVKQNADNARQANELAVSASEVATQGGNVVSQVVDTMGSINASSRKISDITSVIDGIAFQTNILALNAAVEAARAGEQGRGFAVVASEVRTLAQRSAAAAKEIKELIENSVAQVDIGSKLVEQAGSTMNDVVSSVRRVTDIVAEISSASQEQSDGIEQVNIAITQMDEATQQNAALVEEAAAAAQSMQEQAETLTATVGFFKLDHTMVAEPAMAAMRTMRAPATRAVPAARPKAAISAAPRVETAARPTAGARLPGGAGEDVHSWEQF